MVMYSSVFILFIQLFHSIILSIFVLVLWTYIFYETVNITNNVLLHFKYILVQIFYKYLY